MITENLSTLKIYQLTQEQFDEKVASNNIDPNALYMTPDEEVDLSEYAKTEHINSNYETKSDASSKLAEAKSYADSAASTVKNDLLNGAGAAYDTLKELGDLINENNNALDALETVASGKADKEHTHDEYALKTDVENIDTAKDWDQNDSTAEDYIKNRTHWMEYELEELLTSVTVDIGEDGEGAYETDITLVEGEKYVVEFEDKSYICTAKTFTAPDGPETITYIGNSMMINGINLYDYPFILCTGNIPGTEGMIIVAKVDISTGELLTSTDVTFSLTHLAVKEVHKLDSRYIPNSDWNAKESEPGYILNRTHWVDAKLEELIPETTFITAELDGPATLSEDPSIILIEGETYVVKLNNVEYELVCANQNIEEISALMLVDETNGFAICYAPEGSDFANMLGVTGLFMEYNPEIEEAVISVFHKKEEIHHLDQKYIKDMYYSEFKDILPEIEFQVSEEGEVFELGHSIGLEEGKTYQVNWGGTIYNCKCKAITEGEITGFILGSLDVLIYGDLTKMVEPFIIMDTPFENTSGIISLDENPTNTISISLNHVNKLDNKYLDLDWLPTIKKEETFIIKDAMPNSNGFYADLTMDMLVANDTYNIYLNGINFQTTAKSCQTNLGAGPSDVIILGNPSTLNMQEEGGIGNIEDQEDSGEPFTLVVGFVQGLGNIALLMDREANSVRGVSLSISQTNITINKLPNEYLDLAWLPVMLPSEELFYETTVNNTASIKAVTDFDWSALLLGEQVVVYYNEQRYELEVKSYANAYNYIGNLGGQTSIDGAIDTGEPFVIYSANYTGANTIFDLEENATVKVYKLSTNNLVPNKIPVEFLPDDIGGSSSITKVSELENDIGYITKDEIPSEYAKISDIPTGVSQLTNDTGYITSAVSDLVNYYNKSETYSQEEINNKISAIPKFTISVVTALPTENISETTVYLMTSGDETNNLYTEYIYANGKWEILGRQELDLSGKADKATTLAGYGITDGVTKYDLEVMHRNSYLVNGSNPGSLRSIVSAKEDDSYEIGSSATSFGDSTKASGNGSFVNGYNSIASGEYSYAEGWFTESTNKASHAEGYYTNATGPYSHAEGEGATSLGQGSHAEGYYSEAHGDWSHTEGRRAFAIGTASHAEGHSNMASYTITSEDFSEITDPITINGNTAYGNYSHVEGNGNLAYGLASHAEGDFVKAFGTASHAEGILTKAIGNNSHAEGSQTKALGVNSHAEGVVTQANGDSSHAEGYNTWATGNYSHSEGQITHARGLNSHAEGFDTYADSDNQHVQGKSNIVDYRGKYAHIVGNGAEDENGTITRSNAHTLDWSGNAEFAGDVKANACGGENPISLIDIDNTTKNIQSQLNNKANNVHGIYFGRCESSASTVGKIVDLDDPTGFELVPGAVIAVKFTATNGASDPTLNVNNTGAKPMFRYGSTRVSTGTSTTGWRPGSVQFFIYDGVGWVRDFWENSTYTLSTFSVNATAEELNYCSGVTSNIQTQLDSKPTIQLTIWEEND